MQIPAVFGATATGSDTSRRRTRPCHPPCRRAPPQNYKRRLGCGCVCGRHWACHQPWGICPPPGQWWVSVALVRCCSAGRHLPRGFSCQESVAAGLCGVTAAGPGWRGCWEWWQVHKRPRQRRAVRRSPAVGGAPDWVAHASAVSPGRLLVGKRATHLPGWPRPRRRLTPRLRPLGVAFTEPASRSTPRAGVRDASGASPERTQPAGPTRASCGGRLPAASVPTPCAAGGCQDALQGGSYLAGDAAVGGHLALEAVGGERAAGGGVKGRASWALPRGLPAASQPRVPHSPWAPRTHLRWQFTHAAQFWRLDTPGARRPLGGLGCGRWFRKITRAWLIR